MKANKKSLRQPCAAVTVVLPMALAALVASPQPAGASAGAAVQTAVLPSDAQPAVSGVAQINSHTFEVNYSDGRQLTIDFYADNIFRLFRDDSGGIVRDPVATPPAKILVDNARRATGRISSLDAGGTVQIATPCVSIDICRATGVMSVADLRTGRTAIDSLAPAQIDKDHASVTLLRHDGEYFYGGGVQNGRFSHRGESIAIENTNNWVDGGVASPAPFYWSTGGYGMLWNTFRPGRYDFGSDGSPRVSLQHSDNYLDLFFMVDSKPEELLADYYQLTGNPVLMPKFGFYEGHLNAYNRDYWKEAKDGFMLFEDGKRYNESQKDNGGTKESLNGEKGNYQFSARAAIDRYVRNDMPLGWFLPNDGYGAGYGQTGTLDGNIENLRQFGDYARSKGVEIGLWTQSDLHPKPGVEALLQRDIVKEVRDAGVRVLKTDVAWVGYGYSFGLNGVADVAGIMPYYGADARPFIITLDGWAGTQRYATVWSGDQTGGDWEYIRFHIPTFIGSGLSGQPNITSDVDGIFGGKNVPVNVREFQWKTFTPMELNMDGWGATPKYPEVLGEPAASINRSYLKLKSMLMPYTYSIAREAVCGKPMVRAMFLDWPCDFTHGTRTQYQYMYGPSLLVAPVYRATAADSEGNDIRNDIYLPSGTTWIDYWNGDAYEGGRIINEYPAPLWKIPVFVKADAIIPMTNPNNNPSQIRADYRAYEIYATPGAGATFDEYDDDGRTTAYLGGQRTLTHIATKGNGKGRLDISIAPTEGGYDGFEPQKLTEIALNVTRSPKKVAATVGGRAVKLAAAASRDEYDRADNAWYYDAQPNLNRFATPGTAAAGKVIAKNAQLMVKIGKTDVRANAVGVTVDGFEFATAGRMLAHTGQLKAPDARVTEEGRGVFDIAPSWTRQDNADYYEIDYGGETYSTIHGTTFAIEGLQPDSSYTMRVRAVNRDGCSPWTTVAARTKTNPLQYAIKGIKAQTTCRNQQGQSVQKLFDFDTKTLWHSEWGKTDAVPCDLTADLRSVNQLDRLEYIPREDAGNGTLLEGTVAYSKDRQNWSEPVPFAWQRNADTKTVAFSGAPEARYVRLHIDRAVGGYASGREMYIYKVAGTESVLQGDINHDHHIDENDLTSYMNYTGLRRGDSDFDYVSSGDINQNGLIDAYDISCVSNELDGGVYYSNDHCSGSLVLTPNKTAYAAGDIVEIKVQGKNLHYVNALSFALPYSTADLEYIGTTPTGMKDMLNLTYDRLHTNGQKELLPTFVNRGNNFLLDEGDSELFTIRFRAKKAWRFALKMKDGMLVDRNLGTTKL